MAFAEQLRVEILAFAEHLHVFEHIAISLFGYSQCPQRPNLLLQRHVMFSHVSTWSADFVWRA